MCFQSKYKGMRSRRASEINSMQSLSPKAGEHPVSQLEDGEAERRVSFISDSPCLSEEGTLPYSVYQFQCLSHPGTPSQMHSE